jgi:hypothetical protein
VELRSTTFESERVARYVELSLRLRSPAWVAPVNVTVERLGSSSTRTTFPSRWSIETPV